MKVWILTFLESKDSPRAFHTLGEADGAANKARRKHSYGELDRIDAKTYRSFVTKDHQIVMQIHRTEVEGADQSPVDTRVPGEE